MNRAHIERFLTLALHIRTWSKIPTTQVGCVLVADDGTYITGFNGPPRPFNDTLLDNLSREHKRAITAHAEINAITNAARAGFRTTGTMAFVSHPVCAQCMSALINAGVVNIYYTGDLHPDWQESVELGKWLAGNCNIPVHCEIKYD